MNDVPVSGAPTLSVEEFLRAQMGSETAGGCETCEATQELRELTPGAGIFIMDIRHGDGCPTLAAMEG